jgi:serine/threonine-protein kinase
LTAEGLQPVETTIDSDTVPIGVVVSWLVTEQPDLEAGSEVLKGTQVQIVVSSGPSLRSVPALIGLSEEAALALLAETQFIGQRGDDVRDASAAPGTVVTQAPVAGEQLMRGSTIVYSIASGTP